ncbi:MAG: MotA/TolQ/ExbB proton channel family protein [Granulosicoccaceae bacterium]
MISLHRSDEHQHPHIFALIWWLVLLLFCFGLYVAWDLGFIEPIFSKDRSHLTKAIALLTIAASVHAAWHIIRYSHFLQGSKATESSRSQLANNPPIEIVLPLEIAADKLRAPVEAGWFMVDLAIRLGLAGTIIGFILIFSSLTGENIVGEDALQQLLVSMSAGMGTALFTTLAGLIAATFLSIQYMVLGRQTEHVIASLILATDVR